jgi:hypothetical protein
MSKLAAIRPALYIALLVLSAIGTYLVKLRTEGIFACAPEGYAASRSAYLGYCNASAYGDYDHGAFWFDLEPEARQSAAAAQVLFLGSSRMEFAFSTQATDHWFEAAQVPHYLMGFTHTENVAFVTPLLARVQPHARVYVINIDQFFLDTETGPASQILHDADIERRYREKRLWQHLHRSVCSRVHAVCGRQFTYYRTRYSGHWKTFGNNKPDHSFTSNGPAQDQAQWPQYGALARQFIDALPVERGCVVLTFVPYPDGRRAEAQAIAEELGLPLFSPQLPSLQTFDGSHLDLPSAERWSGAFFDAAGAQIRHCLGQDAMPAPAAG